MITRREMLATTAAAAVSGATLPTSLRAAVPAAPARCLQPLRADLQRTVLHLTPSRGRMFSLFSDGSAVPRNLIRPEVIEAAFGKGTDRLITQTDHWRMIDAGWFSDDEIYQPCDHDDPAYIVWHQNYKPEVRAYDLLMDLFEDRLADNRARVRTHSQ